MGSITESIKELLEYLIKRIVDKPVEIEINVTSTTKSIIVQIKSAKDDIGKIIGRTGRTINALKIITTVVKNTQFLGDKKDVFIEIIEDEKSSFYNKKKSES
jgi:predicted RNA-binding protein YlqC (UPF0109 family)